MIESFGSGVPIVLIPGGNTGLGAFPNQVALSESGYRLLTPAPRTEIPARIDFEQDAAQLQLSLPTGPLHIVGHSYGALTAIHLAALRARGVLSLLLIEPAAMSVARGVPEVEHHIEEVGGVFERAEAMTIEEFRAAFVSALGSKVDREREMSDVERMRFELLRQQRLPWTARLPLSAVRGGAYPKLVVSGGSDPMYEVIADRVAVAIDAVREVVHGAGHRVQDATAFNRLLERLLSGAG